LSDGGWQVSDFDYELPEELIAQTPPAERGSSRMLVVSPEEHSFHDDEFRNLSTYLNRGDCLVLNNTKVFPARLQGRRNTPAGARVEIFLLRALDEGESTWRALVKPAKRVHRGDLVLFESDLNAEIVSESDAGERTLRFSAKGAISETLERIGQTPLPPYIHRQPMPEDRDRYQTVFARSRGSVAAPTAGLHFTTEMLDACKLAGAEVAYVTLHVGLGTFAPMRTGSLSTISLHEEYFEITDEAAEVMKRAARLVCVGTTSVRTVETAMLRGGLHGMKGETNLFIQPGFRFQATGAMLTNFHLPQSSLLMLVCAFAGRDVTLSAYRHAVQQRYRFFSYGDCMFIER
jgi:S-adenosylmethionine:tRNA ribosyltransferase-isomerase